MSDLRDTLSRAAASERRHAVRALLRQPLLGQRDDPETYAAVVRHRRALVDWFAEHTGWSLVVDESGGVARLHKVPARPDATHPAVVGRNGRAFNRRRYTLLCLALAALSERAGQTSLKHLVEAVEASSSEQSGIEPFDATRHSDRRAFVDALKLLAGLGLVTERDGDADRYANSGTGDALYDVDDRRLAQLIAAPSSPSLVDRPEDLPVEAYPDTEEGTRLRARHQVSRRLLDDPVVYYDELAERERDWITHSLRFVHDTLDRDVGLEVERRAEGLLAVDADRQLTDEVFPDGGSTVRHAALLFAEQLTGRVRAVRGSGDEECVVIVSDAEATTIATDLVAGYGQRCGWSSAYREPDGGARLLARDALALLERFRLVIRRDGGWQPRPAIARFAPAVPRVATASSSRATRSHTGANPPASTQQTLLASEDGS